MSVVVQAQGFQNQTVPFDIALPNPITLGNIIVVYLYSGGGGPTNPGNINLTDSVGNAYVRGVRTTGGEEVQGYYAYITQVGSPLIHVNGAGVAGLINAIVVEIQGQSRKFILGQTIIGTFTPGIGGNFPAAFDTGAMPVSGDAVIMSILTRDNSMRGAVSASGDTLVGYNTPMPAGTQPAMALFEQSITGTGQGKQILLECALDPGAIAPAGGSIATMLFSKPLARPGGLVAQYAVAPGRGYGDGSLSSPSDGSFFSGGLQSQRTVNVFLPYQVKLGSLVYFVLTQDILSSNTLAVQSPDAYGNIYTPVAGADDTAHGSRVVAYYTFIQHLPPAGELFKASFTAVGPFNTGGVIYQAPGAFLVERADITSGVPFGTNGLSASGGPPVTLTTNSLSVGNNTLLTAIADLQITGNWTALGGYTLRSQWNQAAFNDPSSPNDDRMATIALEDKIVNAGNYNAQIQSDNVGGWGMILLAVTIPPAPAPLTIACPIGGNAATVGVPYTATLVAAGGVPPYTFSITGGALPPGLILNSVTGVISGTPTVAGSYSYTATVTDSLGTTASVAAPCPIVVAPSGGGGGGSTGSCRSVLHIWQSAVAPQVEITQDRNDDWTDCGTPGLKFFQGFKLDADTFGFNKVIQIRNSDDGSLHVPQTSPINHAGRQIKPYSFAVPFLAHMVRRESLDLVAWRKFGISYIWEPAPEFTYTWKTQRTAHGLSGFHHLQRMLFAYASSSVVTLTVTAFDGTSPQVVQLPSTGGVYKKVVVIFTFNKGLLYEYLATVPESGPGMQIWENDLEVVLGEWGRQGSYINYPLLGGQRGDKATI